MFKELASRIHPTFIKKDIRSSIEQSKVWGDCRQEETENNPMVSRRQVWRTERTIGGTKEVKMFNNLDNKDPNERGGQMAMALE